MEEGRTGELPTGSCSELTRIFASLNRTSIGTRHLCCFRSLGSLDDNELHRLAITNTTKIFPRVVLNDGSLMYKDVFTCVAPREKKKIEMETMMDK